MPSRPCPSHACTCVFTIYVAGVGSGKSKDFRARLGWAGIWVCHSTCGSWSKLFHCICQVGANELLGSCGGGQNCMVHSGAKSGYSLIPPFFFLQSMKPSRGLLSRNQANRAFPCSRAHCGFYVPMPFPFLQ